MNIKGGSLAAGHPFAATGGRILATLAKIIDQNNGGRGLISICAAGGLGVTRSEEHTSELQSLMRISYAVFCLKKTNILRNIHNHLTQSTTTNSKPEYPEQTT